MSTQLAQTLYIAYYGRPADPSGLAFWAGKIESDGVESVLSDFGNSAEFDARFGDLSNNQLVNNLYNQLFGRDAEPEGLTYWAGKLSSGELSLVEIAYEIALGAQDTEGGAQDAATLEAKLAAADAFTAAIDTTAEIVGYEGDAAADAARDFLASVEAGDEVSAAEAQAAVDAVLGANNPGNTFNLTDALSEQIVGTDGDDTINATEIDGGDDDTLNVLDTIDGGEGRDTFNIFTDGSGAFTGLPAGASVENVEVVNIFQQANTSVTVVNAQVDASEFVGAEQVWQIADGDVDTFATSDVDASTVAGFRGNSVIRSSVQFTGAEGSVVLDGVNGVGDSLAGNSFTLGVAGGDLETLNVSASFADTDVDNQLVLSPVSDDFDNLAVLDSDRGLETSDDSYLGSLTEINLDVASDFALGLLADDLFNGVETLDASASAGGMSANLSASDADLALSSVIATEQRDDLTTDINGFSAAEVAIDLGAGNDRFTLDLDGQSLMKDDDDIDPSSISVTLGGGEDTLTLTGSGSSGNATGIDGDDETEIGGIVTVEDFSIENDTLDISGLGSYVELTNSQLSDIEAADSLEAAIDIAAGDTYADDHPTIFNYDGDAYVYQDTNGGADNDQDILVQLVGVDVKDLDGQSLVTGADAG